MSPEQRKRITYDLALEYAKQQIFIDFETNIPSMIDHFAEICEKFDTAIKQSSKIHNLF